MLALKRQVKETGRIFLPTASITVIKKPEAKAKKLLFSVTKDKLDGVVKEGNKKPKNFLLKNRE